MKNVVLTLMLLAVCGVAIADATIQDSPVVWRASDGTWYGHENDVASPYMSGNPMPVTTSSTFGGTAPANAQVIMGDVNGDGVDDIVMTKNNGSNATTWQAAHSSYNPVTNLTTFGTTVNSSIATFGGNPITVALNRFLGDINGDGRDDAVVCNNVYNWNGRYSNASGLSSTSGQPATYQYGLTGDKALMGDLNGDNMEDIVLYRPNTPSGGGTWFGSLSSATAFGGNGAVASLAWGLAADRPLVGDLNGDGRDDIVLGQDWGNGLINWAIGYTGAGGVFNGLGTATQAFGLLTDTPMLADINGDGKKDLLAVGDNGAGLLSWRAMFSTGTGFSGLLDASGTFGVTAWDVPLIADLNSIPEPATLVMLGLGSLTLIRRKRA
jgi:hypothetical protein